MQTKTHINLDPAFRWLTLASGLAVLLLVGSILYTLVMGAMPALKHFGFGFLISQEWDPAFMEFGALSSVYGTLVSTAIGMLIAVPLSLVIALFLVEIAPPAVSRIVGGAIVRKGLVNKVLRELEDMKKNEREAYEAFFTAFGTTLKEGVSPCSKRRSCSYSKAFLNFFNSKSFFLSNL